MKTINPEDQHIINMIKLSPLSEDRKKKLEMLLPKMTDAQKLKILSVISTQLVMQVEYDANKEIQKKLEEFASNPEKSFDENEFSNAITKVWEDFMAKKVDVKDQGDLDSVRSSLQALQEKLKKISSYANEAQDELTRHLN